MKLIIQRVKSASVVRHSDKKQFGKIGQGLFVLVGFKKGDKKETVELITAKLSKLRIMSDGLDKQSLAGKAGKMNLSVMDTKSEVLVVSQFTLYANTEGGNRPSFIDAEEPKKAKELYEYFIDKLKEMGVGVATGSFGDYMDISAELDGPVTITL